MDEQVGAQVHVQIRAQVDEQVGAQVHVKVGAQVDKQVGAQVHGQVGAQVDVQVRAQVAEQVDICPGLSLRESCLSGTSGEPREAVRNAASPYEKNAFLSSPGLRPGAAWQRNSGPRKEREHMVNRMALRGLSSLARGQHWLYARTMSPS